MSALLGLDGLVLQPPRRAFVMTSLMAGFTLAVPGAAEAAAIHTDSAGLHAGEVRIPATGGTLPGYAAAPAAPGRYPVVLVIEEIFGVHEHIKDLCRRLAKAGYLAVAPELYARIGDLSTMTDVGAIIRDVISKAPDAQMLADLDSAAAWASTTGIEGSLGDPAPLGVTGFCRGGRNTWLYAAHNPAVKAAVAWYGPVGGATTPIQPRTAADVAAELKAPLLGLYGGADTGIPVADVEAAAAKARAAGKTVELRVYPEAPHGFNADYRPSYREDVAKDGWARMLAWFKAHGVG
ncbi:dienelactone hydrolase family protein [Belnapia sp. T18]|uniref:Dienelactone hydrolase family protein n=1 Tax=Belnapia arida TaxID=2804533 RepID=A0ABS1U886_9PROT|nr:dienelactone hydrolase family protein [Belnapia arida]MBL6079942.1 dienelactone hydrolase family protein [Belnapia arida]